MRAIRFLLHGFAYLFHFVLALFLAGVSLVALLSRSSNFDLGVIPWFTGQAQAKALLAAGLVGLLAVLLAVLSKFRPLLPAWALVVLVVVVWGYFLGPYSYDGWDHFQQALCMVFGSLLAFLGSLSQARSRRG